MKIDRDELFRLYMLKVNEICEECDWVTSFGPEEIINMVADIVESNPIILTERD
jgi:hypothetical protein